MAPCSAARQPLRSAEVAMTDDRGGDAQQDLEEAARSDPLAAEPWRALAGLAFQQWQHQPNEENFRRFDHLHDGRPGAGATGGRDLAGGRRAVLRSLRPQPTARRSKDAPWTPIARRSNSIPTTPCTTPSSPWPCGRSASAMPSVARPTRPCAWTTSIPMRKSVSRRRCESGWKNRNNREIRRRQRRGNAKAEAGGKRAGF